MMILSGSKLVELSQEELAARISGYQQVHIDIGTGDGRNIFKSASKNPDTFYIGIDPAKDNMLEISKKISKKPAKGGLENVILVVASVESLPPELYGMADSISIYFPWGTLLECVIKPVEEMLACIAKLAKDNTRFEFITTYSGSYEEGEMTRRELPPISLEYFSEARYVTAMKGQGFHITQVDEYDNEYVKQFNSLWAKRLAFGRKRAFYRIAGNIEKTVE